jgi:c-di-GMP-binding flagellar brake protein YcgR
MAYRSYSGSDRRRFQRLDVNIAVFYRVDLPLSARLLVGNQEVEATILNLSVGGIALITKYNIPAGTQLLIRFSLTSINKQGEVSLYGPLELKGDVRHSLKWENDNYRLGISFTDIERKDKLEIARFVQMALGRRKVFY